MLTPSGVTYANYWGAIKNGNATHVRITFLGQSITLTDADIDVNSGLTLTDMLNGEQDLVFGKAVCKQVSMGIINSSNLTGLVWTGEFKLEMGVEISGTTNWVQIGLFSGERPRNISSVRVIQFTAYDRMTKFDAVADDFVKKISYPATLSTIYSNLCSFVGMSKVSGNELSNIMNRSFSSAPADMGGYTCRDILSWIAEACGCYAKIDANGKVKMVWYTANSDHAVTADEEFSISTADMGQSMTWDDADTYTWDQIDNLTWNDVTGYWEAYKIDQIYVKQLGSDLDVNYPYPYGGNVYRIVENPFLPIASAADITNYIVPIYNRMTTFGGYLPATLTCVGNWCVEAGDIITVSANGTNISLPIFVKTMRWNGAVDDEYETTGNNERATYTNEKTKQKVLESRKIEMYVAGVEEDVQGVADDLHSNYYQKRSGISIVPEGVEISGAKFLKLLSGGYIDIDSPNFKMNSDLNTLLLSATNFLLSSIDKKMTTGNWTLGENGIEYNYSIQNTQKKAVFKLAELTDNQIPYTGDSFESGIAYDYGIYIEDGEVAGFTPMMSIYQGMQNNGQVSKLDFESSPSNNGYPTMYIRGDHTDIVLGADYFGDEDTYHHMISLAYIKYINYQTLHQRSSRDIKHDIQPMESMGEKLDRLEPVTFVYDSDENEEKRMGLIYEDTMEVMPEICTQDESNKAINYIDLIPALLKEIQDLRKRVAELERRL